MNHAELLNRIDCLNIWSRGGERAPHKPLLLLLALAKLAQGKESFSYEECEPELTDLLREFGPSRSSYHPEYPFWRLQNDGLWRVSSSLPMKARKSNTDPLKSQLRKHHAIGSLSEDVIRLVRRNPVLLGEMAALLLDGNFPVSVHQDILDAIGLSIEATCPGQAVREPQFRSRVLTAYQYRCALCGLDIRIGNLTVGLEAAHIRWHQAGGPSIESNALALCSLHHKVFDLGAFTIGPDYKVLVSEKVHGTGRFEDVLLRHHGMAIMLPVRKEHLPASQYLSWHRRQVFKEAPRPMGEHQSNSSGPTSSVPMT